MNMIGSRARQSTDSALALLADPEKLQARVAQLQKEISRHEATRDEANAAIKDLEYLRTLKSELDQREHAVAGLEDRENKARAILGREAALERREKQAEHDDKELAHARDALAQEREELGRRVKQIRDLVHG
jgi:chromosome segregation ATPase